MTMPRLHPDDLDAITKGVAEIISPRIIQSIEKSIVASNQTFTVEQVAKFVNSDYTTIIRHINKGILEATRTGKKWAITQEALNNYKNSKKP